MASDSEDAVAETPGTVVRAVTIPVSAPVDTTWKELGDGLTAAWRLSTHAANWCVQELFKRDVVGAAKAPPAVKPKSKANPDGFYAYGAAMQTPWAADWAGAKSSLQCVLRAVERKYRQDRFDIVVRHDQKMLSYRYPFPYPVHNRDWTTGYLPGDFPGITVPLPGVGRVQLRLKRRADFRRQLALFRMLHTGEAERGEAALYRDGKGNVLVKLVGHFPKRPRGAPTRVCFLHTDPNALLVAEIDGRAVTVTNADHLRRATAVVKTTKERHRVFLERAWQDKKREVRMDPTQRDRLNRVVDARSEKQRHRLDTFTHQVSAQVARLCERQGVRAVAYCDGVKSFFGTDFPWHTLKERLKYKLDGMGVEWIDGRPEVAEVANDRILETAAPAAGV